jgi:hypothetical protein
MAEIVVQEPSAAGLTPTYAAAGGPDFITAAQTGRPYLLHVKNGSGVSVTVTVNDPTSVGPVGASAFNADVALAVPAGQERMLELDPVRFKDPVTGQIDITYSATTSVTVAAFLVER